MRQSAADGRPGPCAAGGPSAGERSGWRPSISRLGSLADAALGQQLSRRRRRPD